MVATLPLILIWDLQLPKAKKLSVAAVFAVGYIICGMGVARVVYTHKVFFETYDVTWWSAILGFWALLELTMGIVVACAPALKVFFTKIAAGTIPSRPSLKLRALSYDSEGNTGSGSTDLPQRFKDSKERKAGLYTQELASSDADMSTEDCKFHKDEQGSHEHTHDIV